MNEKKHPQSKITEQIAEIIRIVTVPPVITAVLLTVILLFSTNFDFKLIDFLVLLVCLSIIPVCVYPLCRTVPSLKKKGRNGERRLAFVFNIIGYAACFVFGAFSSNNSITLLATTYFISVIILTVLNKLLHIRASGHAASSFMPEKTQIDRYYRRCTVRSRIVWNCVHYKNHFLKRRNNYATCKNHHGFLRRSRTGFARRI